MKTTEKNIGLKRLFRPAGAGSTTVYGAALTVAEPCEASAKHGRSDRLENNRRGFNLAEIVVASAVIALMMMSLISYVHSAGMVWQKSHATISLVNEGNTLLDFVEREIWHAEEISVPTIGATSIYLQYAKQVTDYDVTPATWTLDFQITCDFTTGVASTAINLGTPKWTDGTYGAQADGWASSTINAPKRIVLAQHNFNLCNNIKELKFFRKSNRLIEVLVKLSIPRVEDDYEREIVLRRMMMMR